MCIHLYKCHLQKDTERSPLSDKKNQPSGVPPVRNPFKAPTKVEQTSEWKKLQESKAEMTKSGQHIDNECKKTKEDEMHRNKTEKEVNGKSSSEVAAPLNGGTVSSAQPESWKNKKLPPGMKIKKRTSDEERKCSSSSEAAVCEGGSSENTKSSNTSSKCESRIQTEKQTKPNTPRACDGDKRDERAATEAVLSEVSQQNLSQKAERYSVKTTATDSVKGNMTSSKTVTSNRHSQPDTTSEKSLQSGRLGSPNSTLKDDSASTKLVQNSDQDIELVQKKTQKGKSTINSPFGDWSEEDDDVQLVSVQPGPGQTSKAPIAPVQKTLTSYPGFQPASKIKGEEEDPRALHSQLTSQLKQKKVLFQFVSHKLITVHLL